MQTLFRKTRPWLVQKPISLIARDFGEQTAHRVRKSLEEEELLVR